MATQPAWLTPQVQPQQVTQPMTGTPDPQQAATAMSAGQVPSYVNLNDPVQAAVWQSFQKKGITPRDQGDFQYWVDKINQTGGFGDAGNKQYWLDRMSQSSGGAGDYGQGGGTLSGGPSGSGFSFDPSQVANDPGYKFALSEGLNAIQGSAAARGTLLGTGTLKDLTGFATGQAYQGENQLYNQNLGTFQTNFNNLGTLANLGYNATGAAAGYNTGAANAGANGTINTANQINNGANNIGNAYQNAQLYRQFNPQGGG